MWISRIAVEHWRGLTFDLAGLSQGLNLICGPNESGKSRLAQALRFALFESSRGRSQHKRELESWGLARGKPRVRVELELGGARWQVEKVFLDTGFNTQLRGAATTLEGEAAEAHLAELLGVAPGGSTEMKAEDRGIWSLLWVEQGQSSDAPGHNPRSQAHLQERLTAEIGEVAAGEFGRRLLGLAEAQRNRFYTAGRDSERAELTGPRQQVEQIRERLAAATERRDQLARQADELAAERERARDLTERVADAERRLTETGERHRQAAVLGAALELSEAELHAAEIERERCLGERDQARALAEQIQQLHARELQSRSDRAAADAARAQAQRALEQAEGSVAQAEQRLTRCEAQLAALRRRRASAALHEALQSTRARLLEANALARRIAAIRAELAALPVVSPEDVERLRVAREARDAARARLDGASVSVELEAAQTLRVNGEPLAAGATRTLLIEDERRIEVEGIVSLVVRPGGGELARLREALTDADRALVQLLESLGVDDPAQAAQIAQARRDHELEIARLRRELDQRFPEGRDELTGRVRDLEAKLEAAGPDAALPFDAAAFEAAEVAAREASERRETLRARRDALGARLAEARERLATVTAELTHVHESSRDASTRGAALPDAAALAQRVEAAERHWREQLARRDEAKRQFDALGGEALELDLRRAEQARDQLHDALRGARERCIRLEETLNATGDDGRHEQVQELAAELATAETALARVLREAAAAKRLHEVLAREHGAARERLTQPVVERIRPYLSDLFPGSEVWLDDALNLQGLRGDVEERFGALSGGAREQLGLLVRIGLAEVIGRGESFPLVLDDVLVNTDAARIERVQRLLYKAAQRMQILLFTCHGPLFDALGPDARVELPARERQPGAR